MSWARPFQAGRHRAHEAAREAVSGEVRLEADVVVIGAGAGGTALAAAVSAAGMRVLLLEEGRFWQPADFRPNSPFALRHLYQGSGSRAARGNVVMPLPGGRGVGGSTLINSAICFRLPPEVMRQWREDHGVHTLETARFEAYFDRLWEALGVTVQSLEVQRLNNTVFRDGAEKLGLKGAFMARSAPGCVGCGICQYGCPTGGKASVDRTLLVEALATGHAAVWSDCRVRSARTEGDRVVEVSGDVLDPESQEVIGRVVARADHFVVAGGPIQSPYFLLANRLAPPDPCGRHLVVHPTAQGLARFPFEIRPWHGVTQGYYVDCWDRGFLLQTYTVNPDQYFALLPTAVGEETMKYMADLRFLGSAGTLVHDEDSEGQVSVTPVGPDISYTLVDPRVRLQ